MRYRATGKKGQVTVVTCASGQILPPTIIFDAKNVNHFWTIDGLPDASYGCSDKGWMTTELFEPWLVNHFLKHAVSAQPLLLLLDGHSIHHQPEVIRLARDRQVLMLCLPPHTTHDAQPLDCTVFSPFKSKWREVCHVFLQKNPGKIITKFNFNALFSKSCLESVTSANAIARFKSCGVFSFNPNVFQMLQTSGNSSMSEPVHNTEKL